MRKNFTIILIVFIAIPFVFAKNNHSNLYYNLLPNTEDQGGILEFNSTSSITFENSSNNTESIVLSNYEGLPLKAIQFKIMIFNDKGNFNFKSLQRGLDIPQNKFLFDYQVQSGEKSSDGSSVDVVSVVILGNGEYVLQPKDSYSLVNINYDVTSIAVDSAILNLELNDVLGATCTPVQDAKIFAGEKKTICLRKAPEVNVPGIIVNQNYPNPFNPSTKINFTIVSDGFVELKIYNSIGEEIMTLINEYKTAGSYAIDFNAANLSSGVYFYKITSGSFTDIKKMTLIK
jgi:hypothetical protein